eukprot:3889448-Amphidinium_carterae.1
MTLTFSTSWDRIELHVTFSTYGTLSCVLVFLSFSNIVEDILRLCHVEECSRPSMMTAKRLRMVAHSTRMTNAASLLLRVARCNHRSAPEFSPLAEC